LEKVGLHVVGHQTVGIEKEWQSSFLHGQKRKELLIVLWRVEHLPTIIASTSSRYPAVRVTKNFVLQL
jgi:hypothetical protein